MKNLPTNFLLIVLWTFLLNNLSWAQQEPLPATDIYVLDITTDKKGRLNFENPSRINTNDGYDNQPWWYADGTALLYSSVQGEGDTAKADIYKFVLSGNKNIVVINTPLTAEYSPMLMNDKLSYSVVRVLEDDSTQVLAKCFDKQDDCVGLMPKVNKVGYYMWIDGSRVAMFVLDDPATLQLGNIATGKVDTVAEDVGRCIQKVPGKNVQVAFVDKSSNPWKIKIYDGKTGNTSTVVNLLGDEDEDFCYMPDGSILMGTGSELYRYIPPMATTGRTTSATANEKDDKNKDDKNQREWELVADFDGTLVEYFYRLAVSPKGDKIAIVTYEDEKP